MPVPNDEQTCSLFSLVVYSYLDPIIFLGGRVSHLRFDQLPPLSDTDFSKKLTEEAFPVSPQSAIDQGNDLYWLYQYLDPYMGTKRFGLLFGLLWVFRQ